jgi:transposase InsO family protein
MSNGTARVHRNAPLTPTGRRILIERVESGRPVAHVAKEMGISRTCAHRWVGRFRKHGWAGLQDRSSRPRSCPHATAPEAVEAVISARTLHREGPADLAVRCGVPERTISRIIARAGLPRLWELDPVTGERIRAGRASETRYERAAPGDLLHLDVKKLGAIPEGGGWRVHGRSEAVRGRGIGYDYVHVAVDDCSRLAYADAFMAAHGAPPRRVMTDNAMAYVRSTAFRSALETLGAKHVRTKPRHPWQNGKAERFNRTLQKGWAYRRAYANGQDRSAALPVWLHFYNHQRRHTALGGQPPITRCNQPAG